MKLVYIEKVRDGGEGRKKKSEGKEKEEEDKGKEKGV